ncbi:MAG: GNAT family N-acetyltransferase [Myxococcaceae bacterium]
MREVRALRSFDELGSLSNALDEINLASPRASPFNTISYLRAHFDHDEFAEPFREPLFLVAFEDGAPRGYLSLCRVSAPVFGLRRNMIRVLANHDNDRPTLVARAEDEAWCAAEIWRHLLEREPDWTYLALMEQDERSPLVPPLAKLDTGCYLVRRMENLPNGTIPLGEGELGQYLASLSANARSNVNKHTRKLLRAGQVGYFSSRDARAVPAMLELYLALERRSWKARAHGTIGRHPDRVAFFRALLAPGQPMRLGVSLLTLDGLPIAGAVTGLFQRGLYWMELAYDEQRGHLSPGSPLVPLVVREALRCGARLVNWLGNFAYYKSRWGAVITETRSVRVFRVGSAHFYRTLLGELWRKVFPQETITQREAGFNLTKRAAEGAASALPSPDPGSAEQSARVLRGLASSAEVECLEGAAIAAALGVKSSANQPGQ